MIELLAAAAADPAAPIALAVMLMVLGAGSALLAWQGSSGRRAVARRLKVDHAREAEAGLGRSAARLAAAERRRETRPVLARAADQASRFVARVDPTGMRQLRQRMLRAGYFDPRAPAIFFLARLVGLLIGGGGAFVGLVTFAPGAAIGQLWLATLGGGLAGYLAPGFQLGRRAAAVLQENRMGFPDFMDLMGVCANAGLSMEAALERVSRDLADLYPTLGVHLQILCLEVRAGRAIEEALAAMADRIDIPEVRAFATLLQQSKELGSSLSDALRVFSDDMRHKRLSMAEEKAYALPAKLSVPVTAVILPVVLFVAIWPIIVRYMEGIH